MVLGTVKKIDSGGRVLIPFEIREKLLLSDSTPLNVFEENGRIIISPVSSMAMKRCPICNNFDIPENCTACAGCWSKWGGSHGEV